MKKYTFDEFVKKFCNKNKLISCGIHFEDGWMCSAIMEKYINIIHDVEFYKKQHGDVTYIVTK